MNIIKAFTAALLTSVGGLLFISNNAYAQPCCEPPDFGSKLPDLTEPFKGPWYVITTVSKHTNTSNYHNERNWGFGIERTWAGRNWQIGSYRNSYHKNTSYIMTELTSYQITDTLRFRLNGGLVTGYRYPITPMVLPVWTYERKNWGFDLLTIPPVAGRMGIFALQVKFRF